MTVNDVYNTVYQKYYENNFIPSIIGGEPHTAFFQLLTAITSYIDLKTVEAEMLKKWADQVSWYGKKLPLLFNVVKFDNESDRDFYDRLVLMNSTSNDAESIPRLVKQFVGDAVINDSDIYVLTVAPSQGTWADESSPPTYSIYWDGSSAYWGDENTSLRAVFGLKIIFSFTGSATDPLTYEYWSKPENYTKIEDIVKLFKPPGTNFELIIEKASPIGTITSVSMDAYVKGGVVSSVTMDAVIQ